MPAFKLTWRRPLRHGGLGGLGFLFQFLLGDWGCKNLAGRFGVSPQAKNAG
jgi:hypothetical protein